MARLIAMLREWRLRRRLRRLFEALGFPWRTELFLETGAGRPVVTVWHEDTASGFIYENSHFADEPFDADRWFRRCFVDVQRIARKVEHDD